MEEVRRALELLYPDWSAEESAAAKLEEIHEEWCPGKAVQRLYEVLLTNPEAGLWVTIKRQRELDKTQAEFLNRYKVVNIPRLYTGNPKLVSVTSSKYAATDPKASF